MLTLVSVMIASFAPPSGSLLMRASAVPHVAVRMEEMWTPPKDLGPLPDLDRLFPTDVQFFDVDGEELTFRGKGGRTVEYWVNKKGRMREARIKQDGNSLQISGSIRKPVPLFSLIGFNLEDFVTDVATPKDPADVDKVMALVTPTSREVV